ncbi:tumor necrosis factor receptor superfamily member 1A, partial [Python bivittatus]|uniref:Tumor necrosis factor receptor superfamily member 1A n=1 Tax=Python bivittatus TaxID=176946 RepID=A0A9F5IU43_PYTBI
LAACGCFFLLGGALALCYKKKAMTSARDQPLPAPDLYIAKPHFAVTKRSAWLISTPRPAPAPSSDIVSSPPRPSATVTGPGVPPACRAPDRGCWTCRGPHSHRHAALIPCCFPGSPVPSLPETALLVDKVPAHHRSLQQGRKLYTVINAVPVRRWKEFVRGLGLQDGEIELVELEHSQFREQQYEMLKRWCQRRGASVDAVLATLEAMQLGGCAQELREQLEVEPLQGAALQLG